MDERPVFWSDQLAFGTRKKFEDEEEYVCASGVSPSGVVHAGNFREIITTDFVVKSLKHQGEDVEFIYSWDDYDRFRKVPEGVPDSFEKHIGKPLVEVPDPQECHDSYAEHYEEKLEKQLEDMHVDINFIRQAEKFKNGEYADLIKKGLEKKSEVKEILDKYRKEPLEEPYYPVHVYCTGCGKDFTEVKSWNGSYTLEYHCNECGEQREINFKQEGNVKPPWRIDWPMRWKYEQVNFEPAGKEHSAAGGSRDTGNELSEKIYDKEPPVHQMYEFVTKDGSKISSSQGGVFTLSDLKDIYSPEIIRFLFSETKPNKAFEIPFESEEVIQIYDRFDRYEEDYFEESGDDKDTRHRERVYEQATVEVPESQPVRVPFKHAAFVAQTVPEEEWVTKGIESLKRTGHLPDSLDGKDKTRVVSRLERAKEWARNYAPEKYVYEINWEGTAQGLNREQQDAVNAMKNQLENRSFEGSDELDDMLYNVAEESDLDTGEFFQTAYRALLGRESGPRLSTLIISIGQEQTTQILQKLV
ncbi:lysine--tRNA ligase [Nanohaloarchaea archaeon]|nr:lysine--tRNA ligase [Candidatus Nanohaloarchaea archaeon]